MVLHGIILFVYFIKLWESPFSVTVNFTKSCIFSLCCGYLLNLNFLVHSSLLKFTQHKKCFRMIYNACNFEIKYFWPKGTREEVQLGKPVPQKRGFAYVGFLRTSDIFFRIVQTMESDEKNFSCNFFKVTR